MGMKFSTKCYTNNIFFLFIFSHLEVSNHGKRKKSVQRNCSLTHRQYNDTTDTIPFY